MAFPIPRPNSINQAPVMPPMPMARPDNLIPQSTLPSSSPIENKGLGGSGFTGLFGSSFEDPRTQGILGASAQLLKGGAPSFMPQSLGSSLGSALETGLNTYNRAKKKNLQRRKRQHIPKKLR